ncbi:MAG: type V CRISPR-associated protein Cas12a/Cpf1 [Clostridiales Family XIII bacterium]|jgi:CRISPR-associated protein Cpf1|nr:type V CRISPR-associated protein Cas12a/Cpf1 [Clostridiales Family XIII bacterium]
MTNFKNFYQIIKNLRFELKPIGKTLKYIEKQIEQQKCDNSSSYLNIDDEYAWNYSQHNILENDEHRAECYQKIKKIIDEYHKFFIEKSLKDFAFNKPNKKKNIENYVDLNKLKNLVLKENKTDEQKKKLTLFQSNLRKQIANCFNTNRLFGKDLINNDLLNFDYVKQDPLRRKLIQEFKKFTTYFKGFNENRKILYSSEDKAATIAYRLINENLSKFIHNIEIFEKIKTPLLNKIIELQTKMKVTNVEFFFKLENYSKNITQLQIDIYNSIIGGKTLENGTKIQGLNEYINLYNQQHKNKKDHLPKLTNLFKQILTDYNAVSWLPEQFKDDNTVLKEIKKLYLNLNNEKKENDKSTESIFNQIKKIICNLNTYDLSKIFIRNDSGLTNISQKYLGSYIAIPNAIKNKFRQEKPLTKKQNQENYEEAIDKKFRNSDSFSIQFINGCLSGESLSGKIEDYFKALDKIEKTDVKEAEETGDLFTRIENSYSKKQKYKIKKNDSYEENERNITVKELLNNPYPINSPYPIHSPYSKEKFLIQDKDNVLIIKEFLDRIKEL